MKRYTIVLPLVILFLFSCNKRPELFAGIYLEMPKEEFNKVIEKEEDLKEQEIFVENRYFSEGSYRQYNYKMSTYEYLFDVDYTNNKISMLKGNFYSKDKNINGGIINGNTSDKDVNEILSILIKRYGNCTIDSSVTSERFGIENLQYIYKWQKNNYHVMLIIGEYENTFLLYELGDNVVEKLEKEEKNKKDVL